MTNNAYITVKNSIISAYIRNKKVFRIIAVIAAAALFVGVIAAANSLGNISIYNDAIDYVESSEYDKAIVQCDQLPEDYKDVISIKEYIDILQNYDESSREKYALVLERLNKIDGIQNERVLQLKKEFTANVASLNEQYQADLAKANEIDSQIEEACKSVTIDSEEAVLEAQKAYLEADENVRTLVKNSDKITEALNKIEQQKQDKENAEKVVKLISNIGTVSLNSESSINTARSSYNSLNANAKTYVSNYSDLQSAEETYKKLKDEKEKFELEESLKKKQQQEEDSYSGGTVYWVPNGKVYHSTKDCPTLSRSKTILSGSPPSGRRKCKVCY